MVKKDGEIILYFVEIKIRNCQRINKKKKTKLLSCLMIK